MALSINNQITGRKPAIPSITQGMPLQPQVQPQGAMRPFGGLLSPSAPLGMIGTTPVVSHTISTKPDGSTTHKVTHAQPEEGKPSEPVRREAAPTRTPPPLRIINGRHHVPFLDRDGSMKYINSLGEVH